MRSAGFEPAIIALRGQIDDISHITNDKQLDIDKFGQYLISIGLNHATMKTRIAYVRKDRHLLFTGDFSEIMEFLTTKRSI